MFRIALQRAFQPVRLILYIGLTSLFMNVADVFFYQGSNQLFFSCAMLSS